MTRANGSPTFGQRLPGLRYRVRPGAYGVALRRGRVLVVDAPAGRFLPGGALDGGEEPLDALRREMAEETGYAVTGARPLGMASQLIVTRARGEPIEKQGLFFVVELSEVPATEVIDHDHAATWVDVDEAAATMVEESHAWALRQATESA